MDTRHHSQQRRLSTPVVTDQASDTRLVDVQRDISNGPEIFVLWTTELGEQLLHTSRAIRVQAESL
jgi:hypothetical protein